MESQSSPHQTIQNPTVQEASDIGLIPSSDAPLETGSQVDEVVVVNSDNKPFTKCLEIPLEMASNSQQGSRGVIFTPVLDDQQQQQQQPASYTNIYQASSAPPLEPAKAMNAHFYRCLQAGQIEALKHMLEDEEDSLLDQLTPQQNTPLHIVARLGLNELIEPLLDRRPGLLTQQNMNGELVLHLAAGAGHLEAVKSIVKFLGEVEGRDVFLTGNRDGDTPLHIAARHNHKQVAKHLIDACPEASYCLNARMESPLFVAAELGESELVKAMIEVPVKIDVQSALEEGKSVVHAAISGENLGVLETILSKHKFLINSTERLMNEGSVSPLSYAAFKGNVQMIGYILTHFPDGTYKSNQKGTFPVHIAAAARHKMVIEEFLRFHPDSRELLTFGRNILHMAALHGKDEVVSYILSKPDFDELINARDIGGNTPLHYAVARKYPKVVDALTWDKRVKLDLVSNNGQTAMDMALNFENPMPSFKEQMTWLALRYAGAPRQKFQQAKISKELSASNADNYKDRVNTLSVVATLVTTMTFAAGFTMPGGNNGSEPNLGMANFLKRRIFQLFVISNSIALYTSVLDVLVLIFAMLGDAKLLQVSLKFAVPLLAVSLAMMSISFMSAAYLVVSALKWLGIAIWVMGSIFLAMVLALFVLLSPPLSAKNRFSRYILYVPFRAMLYICEGK